MLNSYIVSLCEKMGWNYELFCIVFLGAACIYGIIIVLVCIKWLEGSVGCILAMYNLTLLLFLVIKEVFWIFDYIYKMMYNIS